jgi:hypothetical protein
MWQRRHHRRHARRSPAATADADGTHVQAADTGALLDTVAMKAAATALAFAPDSGSLYAGDVQGVVFRFAL